MTTETKCSHNKEWGWFRVHGREIPLNGFAVLWYKMIGVKIEPVDDN